MFEMAERQRSIHIRVSHTHPQGWAQPEGGEKKKEVKQGRLKNVAARPGVAATASLGAACTESRGGERTRGCPSFCL